MCIRDSPFALSTSGARGLPLQQHARVAPKIIEGSLGRAGPSLLAWASPSSSSSAHEPVLSMLAVVK
eukprot:2630133-Alexandrium_andersonii.AAC.1